MGEYTRFAIQPPKCRIRRVATAAVQKQLGAFYTSSPVARLLVNWALRRSRDRILDPSCGDGVFLVCAFERLARMGGEPASQIYGVEIDESVVKGVLLPNLRGLGLSSKNVIVSDFFDVAPSCLPNIQAVVGNPPFIRYQTFKGKSREAALSIAKQLGVSLSELTSSWAPFLLNATRFLSKGGRVAMVVPAEISHAAYARPVLEYLTGHFRNIFFSSFRERLFPDLNQDTFLLFAEGFGGKCRRVLFQNYRNLDELSSALKARNLDATKVSVRHLKDGNGRLRNHFLPRELSGLYAFLKGEAQVCRLGELAKVGIGYVTGANEYFHLSQEEVREFCVPRSFLRKTLLRSGIARGLKISDGDWRRLRDQGEKIYLLCIPRVPEEHLPVSIRDYLRQGRRAGVDRAYKCAVRKPWYSVPISTPAEALLTYMSGEAPRVVWNEPGLLATNSVHEVRLSAGPKTDVWKLALSFCCSLSQLSSEIEGHPLGGGMLKLEPSEAEQVLSVRPEALRATEAQFQEIDTFVKSGMFATAIDLADEIVLRETLALTWEQIQVLRKGLEEIKACRRKIVAPSHSN